MAQAEIAIWPNFVCRLWR